MLPVIALVGRPNVGKSTLFNKLTKSRDALVADLPGLTRDRQYGEGRFDQQAFIVIDTGGIGFDEQGLDGLMLEQTQQAVSEADIILLLMDGKAGRTAADEAIAAQVRQTKKPVYVVANKMENSNPNLVMAEFYAMGLGEPIPIAAAHGEGIQHLLAHIFKHLPPVTVEESTAEMDEEQGIKVAMIGRPNVGKSTLVNRILGEERVIAFDEAGTTRDSIFIPFERRDQKYTLIDTAGVRRRGKVKETVEKFSVIKTLKAIEAAHVVVYVIDAQEGIVDHDLRLLGFILDTGTALVLAINKWDGLTEDIRVKTKTELARRLGFVDFAEHHFISALHGTGVGHLFASINEAFACATQKISTHQVTDLLNQATQRNAPPMIRGHRIKLRFAHVGGHNPPTIIIHGNQTQQLPLNYQRYLMKFYRNALKLVGTPLRLQFKTSDNPYKDKKNQLTDRQKQKRRRLKKYIKSRKK